LQRRVAQELALPDPLLDLPVQSRPGLRGEQLDVAPADGLVDQPVQVCQAVLVVPPKLVSEQYLHVVLLALLRSLRLEVLRDLVPAAEAFLVQLVEQLQLFAAGPDRFEERDAAERVQHLVAFAPRMPHEANRADQLSGLDQQQRGVVLEVFVAADAREVDRRVQDVLGHSQLPSGSQAAWAGLETPSPAACRPASPALLLQRSPRDAPSPGL